MISLLSDCDMKALGEKELLSQLQARGELGTSPLRRCKLRAIEQFEQFEVIHRQYIYKIVYMCSTLGSQFTDSLAQTVAPVSANCGTLR